MTLREERERLAAWLAEWRLEQALPPADEAPASAGARGNAADNEDGSVPEGTPPAPGNIVLLPPVGPFTASRPVYVALLAREASGSWLCAPFSRFATPATDGECETGRAAEPLKVVCPWNAGRVPEEVVRRGWSSGRLGAADTRILIDFVKGVRPALPAARRGSPLVHPLDPRRDYIEEERALWFDFRAAPSEDGGADTWTVAEPPADTFGAAADRDDDV